MNTKAFTLLELVFVIVVIGILSAVFIPRIQSNHNAETAIKLINAIRNTQHKALSDDTFRGSEEEWYKQRWHILFSGTTYSIMSGTTYAKDAVTQEEIKNVPLNVDDILFSSSCGTSKQIIFDYMGRPLLGDIATYTSPYMSSRMLKSPCTITLQNSSENDEHIIIHPETGFVERN